jgi:hypothetical protein
MSIVHLPTCPMCKWTMRQVRICVREQDTQATRYRVFECVRCHAELMWTPGMDQSFEERVRVKTVPSGRFP